LDRSHLINSIKLFLFDMDGTLYLGNRLYDFTKELLEKINKSGRKYMFMTNNSSKSVEDYIIKLSNMGIKAQTSDFITSSQATAHYLKQHYPGAILYVCGTESLKQELRREGFTVSERLEIVNCIVMGFDTELTFRKLENVCRLLCEKDIPYIATNGDYVCPTEFGSVPDCGSVCDMIYNATGKRPVVIGKPSSLMPELAMEQTGISKEHTAVIGDRIYTDIKSGINAGVLSILVLSGETTRDILDASIDKPDLVMDNAGEIMENLS